VVHNFYEADELCDGGDYNMYCGSLDKWYNSLGVVLGIFERRNAPETYNAYKDLIEWQYYYFVQNGVIYNFITNHTHIEELIGEELGETPSDTSDGTENLTFAPTQTPAPIETPTTEEPIAKKSTLVADILVMVAIISCVAVGAVLMHKRKEW